MKRKIVGIVVVTLMVAVAIMPALGEIITTENNDIKISHYIQCPLGNTGQNHVLWSGKGDNIHATATTPTIDLSACTTIVLSFWKQYEIYQPDSFTVEVSDDGGATWHEPLEIVDGYEPSWVKNEVDLSAFAGQQVVLRFSYDTGSSSQSQGIHIDDVTITCDGIILFEEDFESGASDWALGGWTIDDKHPPCPELTVGECDDLDTTSPPGGEPTHPSNILEDWIYENYVDGNPGANPGSKDCDENQINQYWAHTFYLAEICLYTEIESATLEITVRNDDDNDHLKVGVINDNSDSWEYNEELTVPLNNVGTITLQLDANTIDAMNTWDWLDVAVDDDSPVDCAKLTVCCEECEPNVDIDKKVRSWVPPGGSGQWKDHITVDYGDLVEFRIDVMNHGNSIATIDLIQDILPYCFNYNFGVVNPPDQINSNMLYWWGNSHPWHHLQPLTGVGFRFVAEANCWMEGTVTNEAVVNYTACDTVGWLDSDTAEITVICQEPIPDLDCEGTLTWSQVNPGSTVTGSFQVMNVGEEGSELNWEITDWPEWGENWRFSPASGEGLTSEDEAVTVDVTFTAPNEENANFTCEVMVINTDNPEDYEILPVNLITPKNKAINLPPWVQWLRERVPLLYQLLHELLRLEGL